MASSICHHASGSSTFSKADSLVLRSLAADLERDPLSVPPDEYRTREERMIAVFKVLLDGTEAELSRDDLNYLLRLDVPRALVAGDTRKR